MRRPPGAAVRAGGAARIIATVGVGLVAFAAPSIALGHALARSFESRLPLAVYLAGAAGAVALSFIFVLARDVRIERPAEPRRAQRVPGALRTVLRAIGVIGLLWILVQGVLGGESDAEVSRLFAWVYGWVGVALISALIGPIWAWLDPFSTVHVLGARALRRAGAESVPAVSYPERLGQWPAVAGFAAVVWLELVASGAGSRTLALVIGAYSVYTLAMMAQFGRQAWSTHGEIFAVWFRLLGRLAPYELVVDSDGSATVVRRRGFASGLLGADWRLEDVVLVGLGTGSILFDGLSQTQVWADAFGLPAALPQTILLTAFMAIIIGAALVVARLVGVAATGAGLLPIAVGYLLAHYFTYLLTDGQRIVIAISDPLQRGANLFGTAFFEPSGSWLPPALVWTLQLASVVGGHMVGAWAGHVVASRQARAEDPLGNGTEGSVLSVRLRQVPLAAIMVALTTLTLWSLGQALFIPES